MTRSGSDEWLGSAALAVVASKGGRPRTITAEFDNLRTPDADSFAWATDGRALYFVGDERTTRPLFRVPAQGGEVEKLTSQDGLHDSLSLSSDGAKLALLRQDPSRPRDVHIVDLKTLDCSRTSVANPQVEGWPLGKVEKLRWKSKDGVEIEGLLVKPPEFKEGTRYPMLTYVHGGPALQFAQGFSIYPPGPVQASRYPVQVLASQGYMIFCPNPRGSAAYGKEFRRKNQRDWGGGDLQDILSGVDHLVEHGMADPERLGLMGWSYGGYMTAYAVTQTNRFKAASMGAGLSNLVSMYGQTDIPEFMEAYFGGPPWDKRELYEQRSAITHISKVKTPVLIQFGEKDERVSPAQGQEFHTALKRLGVPTDFAMYPRQGHNVIEPKLQRDVLTRNVEWFERWLKK